MLEADQGLDVLKPAALAHGERRLGALSEPSHRGAVDVCDPVVVLGSLVVVDILLEDDNVVVWDLVLGRECSREKGSGVLVNDGGVEDGGSDGDSDSGEEREELGGQGDLHDGQ